MLALLCGATLEFSRLYFVALVDIAHLDAASVQPLLQRVGQKMTSGKSEGVAGYMSACIIAAQLVMVPVAILASRLGGVARFHSAHFRPLPRRRQLCPYGPESVV